MIAISTRSGLASLLLMGALCCPLEAAAQNNNDRFVASVHGSSGNALAATFETMGYFAQQQALSQLLPFIQTFGIFLWCAFAIFSLWRAVTSSEYDNLVWLLLGPILFYFVIHTKTLGQAVDWRNAGEYMQGNRANSQEVGTLRVSWLFHQVNRLVSSVSREALKLLTSDRSKELSTTFLTRQELLGRLLSLKVQDGGLATFSAEVLSQCSDELDAARTIAVAERDPAIKASARYTQSLRIMEDVYGTKRDKVLRIPASRESLAKILAQNINAGSNPVYESCFTLTQRRFTSGVPVSEDARKIAHSAATCEELWCWMGFGFQHEIDTSMLGFQDEKGLSKAEMDEIREELNKKLVQPKYLVNPLDPTGKTVNYVPDARDPTGKTALYGVHPVKPDASLIPVIIGGFMIQSEMRTRNISKPGTSHFATRAGISVPKYGVDQINNRHTQQAVIQQGIQENIAVQKQTEIFTFAAVIPYVQGFLLYSLAAIFPFFSLLLLVPDKIGGFLLWIKLWIWAKSWDVGWGLVMLLENFLWNIMPQSAVYDPQKDPNHGPVSVFAAAFSGDPAYGLGNYYTVIATLVMAVPIITAQILLGAHSSLASSFMSGFKGLGQNLAQGVKQHNVVKQVAKFDRLRENSLAQFVNNQVDISNPKNLADNPAITQAMGALRRLEGLSGFLANKVNLEGADSNVSKEELYRQLHGEGYAAHAASGLPNRLGTTTLAAHDTKLVVDRLANNLRASITIANARFNYFKGYSDDRVGYQAYNNMRAGISGRSEHWNFPETTSAAYVELNQSIIAAYATAGRAIENLEHKPIRSVR